MRRISALLLLLLLSSMPVLRAQSTGASLSGRVTDPSKSLIADAKIDAINTATNFHYETTTNNSGEYYLTNLPPGRYQIEIEKPGFKKLIKPDVTLHVQDAREIDFEMTLGSASENITVKGGAALVNTESGTVSTVIDRTFVENLPLNGRSFQTLIMLTPGVVVATAAADDQGQFSVNGQRADANYFTIDGVSANFGVTGFPPLMQSAGGGTTRVQRPGGTNSLVSVDAMQEFRIQTSSFAPEFGRAPGGQISDRDALGNKRLSRDAFRLLQKQCAGCQRLVCRILIILPKPEERQNDFGGVAGRTDTSRTGRSSSFPMRVCGCVNQRPSKSLFRMLRRGKCKRQPPQFVLI